MSLLLLFLPLILFAIILLLNKTLQISLYWSLPVSCFLSFYFYSFGNHAVGTSGAAAGLSIAVLFLLACQIAIISFIAFVVFLRKRGSFFQWTLLALLVGFAIGMTYDRIFIESHEIGEKGNAYIYAKYPAWRILE